MAYQEQYRGMKVIAKRMLLESGFEGKDFEIKVSDMAIHLLDELYSNGYCQREINTCIRILQLTGRLC